MEVLLNCEGNLDAHDDAFHAKRLYTSIIHKDLWVSNLSHQRSAVLYWSILWMMRECYSHTLLPRFNALRNPLPPAPNDGAEKEVGGGGEMAGVDVRFVYGSKRRRDNGQRRRHSSEVLLEQNGWCISYVLNGGHRMHWDAGREHFWHLVVHTLGHTQSASPQNT